MAARQFCSTAEHDGLPDWRRRQFQEKGRRRYDPVVTFRSEHVLLVPRDQAWVTGTLARGGHSAPVAFEAT